MTPENTMDTITIPIDDIQLEGSLIVPDQAKGIVLFSHGSGSGRFSPRNNFVASVLQQHGFATLLLDLLTPEEDAVYETRFNINLLKERLKIATRWLSKNPETATLSVGYFGASTGAAAAIMAAAELTSKISAVVSRGGRPDLAASALPKITTPTLLIVGGDDGQVVDLNRSAYNLLTTKKDLQIIPGATHLFEEPGALEQVADLAAEWFEQHLKSLVQDA